MKIQLIEDAHVVGRGYCLAGTPHDPFEIDVAPSEAHRLVNLERVAIFVDPGEAEFPPVRRPRGRPRKYQNAMFGTAAQR